jgi:hypothetical protein
MKVNGLLLHLRMFMRRFVLGARHVAQIVAIHRASAVEGDDMVHLGTNANPLAQHMVMMAGHMGHHRFACFQAQCVQEL